MTTHVVLIQKSNFYTHQNFSERLSKALILSLRLWKSLHLMTWLYYKIEFWNFFKSPRGGPIWLSVVSHLHGVCSFFSSLLDKLLVTCPNADSCQEELQRGNLDDHLRYRCSGTLVACQFAASGCDYRGPSKSMAKHQTECRFKKEGKRLLWISWYQKRWELQNILAKNFRHFLINCEVKAFRV